MTWEHDWALYEYFKSVILKIKRHEVNDSGKNMGKFRSKTFHCISVISYLLYNSVFYTKRCVKILCLSYFEPIKLSSFGIQITILSTLVCYVYLIVYYFCLKLIKVIMNTCKHTQLWRYFAYKS